MNFIGVLFPYKFNGQWVFDDDRVGLHREPFVAGIDTIIDELVFVCGIPKAEKGFKLLFSDRSFPGWNISLHWSKEESGGNWYFCPQFCKSGWLCPALFKYFEKAPQRLFARAEGLDKKKK